MHEHGPDCLEGPIRGSNAWWRGLAPLPEPAATPAPKTRCKSPKSEETAIRKDLVERVRREIQAGTYDTAEIWEAALDRLLQLPDNDILDMIMARLSCTDERLRPLIQRLQKI